MVTVIVQFKRLTAYRPVQYGVSLEALASLESVVLNQLKNHYIAVFIRMRYRSVAQFHKL